MRHPRDRLCSRVDARETYAIGGWNHIWVEVDDDAADIFVNGQRSLRIPHLKATTRHGAIQIDATAARDNGKRLGLLRELSLPRRARRKAARDWSGVRRASLAVEAHGIADLGRVGAKKAGTQVVVASFEVPSTGTATRLLEVGCRAARGYVNGALLFEGDNRQFSRDAGFLGIFVVEETSGWAAQAQFVDPSALQSAAFEALPPR